MNNGQLGSGSVGAEAASLAEAFDALTARLQAGEAVGLAEVRRLYPAHAEELARLLPALAALGQLSGSVGPGAAAPAGGNEETPGTLGDFRIVREVGRGGMGIVYEAEQVSLGRRVALKVLPLAATLGGTQLQRFHNEARAAAGLHHTNIVPVYAVGCERGVHFYAMQFIDGQSLAAVLAHLREPADRATSPQSADEPTTAHPPPVPAEANGTTSTQPAALLSTAGGARGRDYFRAVAELGVQAAEALDYGHRVGVVHRDVKPGNLLLDGASRLWVTDFGLAQVQGAESLTATGELVGTLRYMSPEQALAKRVPIDHRTDVYSLGATLYELLILRPVFSGSDRQELLRQIAFEEPLPPRRLNRAVPAELETIVLKAMEKAPQDRYATAQELADDLRRWLDDRPIQARRPSVVQQVRKWARRHRPLVGAMIWFLVLMTLVLAASTMLVGQENQRKSEALRLAELNWQTLHGAQAEWKARDERLQRTLAALDATLGQVATDVDELDPGQAGRVQRAVAERVCRLYEEVSRERDPGWWSVQARQRLGWAYVRLGNAHARRGNFAEAKQAYDKAADAFARLASDSSFTVFVWLSIHNGEVPGQAQERSILRSLVDHPEAERRYQQALAAWKVEMHGDFPALRDYRNGQAEFYRQAGQTLKNLGKVAEAERLCRRAVSLREAVLDTFPSDYECRLKLIGCYHEMAGMVEAARPEEARALVGRALAHYKELVERARSYPPEFWTSQGAGEGIRLGGNLAAWLDQKGDRRDTMHAYQLVVHLSRVQVDAPVIVGTIRVPEEKAGQTPQSMDPSLVPMWLANACERLGELQAGSGQAHEAEDSYRQALAHCDNRMAGPTIGPAITDSAEIYSHLGDLFRSTGRFAESEKAFRQALELVESAHGEPPHNGIHRPQHAAIQNSLAWLLATCADATCRDAKQAVVLAQRAVQNAPQDGNYRNTLGIAQYRAGDWAAAVEALDRSVQLSRGGDSCDYFFLAMAHWRLGDKEQARRWYDRATEWMQQNKSEDKELLRFQAEAADLLKIRAQNAAPDTHPPPGKTAAAGHAGA